MAEVFSNSPCMLGKRVLNAHPHTLMGAGGQLDFSSKKRRLGHGAADQGESNGIRATAPLVSSLFRRPGSAFPRSGALLLPQPPCLFL